MAARASARTSPWFVYVLRCRDDSLYTGVAIDVAARVDAHTRGKGARYTRGRGPFRVEGKVRLASKGDALVVEAAVKRLSRREKDALLAARRLGRFARSTLRGAWTAGRRRPTSSIVC